MVYSNRMDRISRIKPFPAVAGNFRELAILSRAQNDRQILSILFILFESILILRERHVVHDKTLLRKARCR